VSDKVVMKVLNTSYKLMEVSSDKLLILGEVDFADQVIKVSIECIIHEDI